MVDQRRVQIVPASWYYRSSGVDGKPVGGRGPQDRAALRGEGVGTLRDVLRSLGMVEKPID